MPTYDYECEKYEHRFEKFQPITEKPITKCPECGGKTRRLIGAGAGILFKGSGFYQTDYRSEGYKKKAEAEKKNTCGSNACDNKKSASSSTSQSKK